jgi:hypothetical protein
MAENQPKQKKQEASRRQGLQKHFSRRTNREDAMGNRNSAAEIELRLEKAQRKTAQAKAYFASFAVGDRVEVATHKGAKQGTIYQVGLKHRHLTVVFDGKQYKTTLSRADYLSRQYQIKKLEEVSQVVRKREIPPKAELQSVFEKCGYKIDALAKHYCIAWLKARGWLETYGLIDVEAKNNQAKTKVVVHDNYCEVVEEQAEVEAPQSSKDEEPVVMIHQNDYLKAMLVNILKKLDSLEEKTAQEIKDSIYDMQESVEIKLDRVLKELEALNHRLQQPTTQVEFKAVADLAERMAKVWTDARR